MSFSACLAVWLTVSLSFKLVMPSNIHSRLPFKHKSKCDKDLSMVINAINSIVLCYCVTKYNFMINWKVINQNARSVRLKYSRDWRKSIQLMGLKLDVLFHPLEIADGELIRFHTEIFSVISEIIAIRESSLSVPVYGMNSAHWLDWIYFL